MKSFSMHAQFKMRHPPSQPCSLIPTLALTMEKANNYDTAIQTPSTAGLSSEDLINDKHGTAGDVRDMCRLGKAQLLRRNFRFFSIFSFTMILLSTWETMLGLAAFSLGNGGTAGLIYMYIVTFVGFGFLIASMAEMASMAPTAGGQYH